MKPTPSLEKLDLSRTLWRAENRPFWQFYCPFCSVTRRLALSPKPQTRHFIQVGLTTLFLTALAWPLFGVKGLVMYLPLWVAFEVLYRMRVRAEMSCKECGFDPILYLSDIPRARREMEAFWKEKAPAKTSEKQSGPTVAP